MERNLQNAKMIIELFINKFYKAIDHTDIGVNLVEWQKSHGIPTEIGTALKELGILTGRRPLCLAKPEELKKLEKDPMLLWGLGRRYRKAVKDRNDAKAQETITDDQPLQSSESQTVAPDFMSKIDTLLNEEAADRTKDVLDRLNIAFDGNIPENIRTAAVSDVLTNLKNELIKVWKEEKL